MQYFIGLGVGRFPRLAITESYLEASKTPILNPRVVRIRRGPVYQPAIVIPDTYIDY